MRSAQRPNILALCSPNQSRLEHIRKLSALRKRYEITCCRIGRGLGWERAFVDHEVEIPETPTSTAVDRIADQLTAIAAPDAIINFSEAYVPLHAELASRFGLLGPSEQAVRVGRNKLHMRQFCAQLGIPVPRFVLATEGNLDDALDL